jgi:superfamily II DNA/RNA helicase
LELVSTFTRSPVRIIIKEEPLDGTIQQDKHMYVAVEADGDEKLAALCAVMGEGEGEGGGAGGGAVAAGVGPLSQAVVFCNTRRKAEWLTDKIALRGLSATCLHGNMQGPERMERVREFCAGSHRLLITTDSVLSVRMNSNELPCLRMALVVNYDLPSNVENYIHRAFSVRGREQGHHQPYVVSLYVTTQVSDARQVSDIESYYSIHFNAVPLHEFQGMMKQLMDAA